jgi:hypothetical protein
VPNPFSLDPFPLLSYTSIPFHHQWSIPHGRNPEKEISFTGEEVAPVNLEQIFYSKGKQGQQFNCLADFKMLNVHGDQKGRTCCRLSRRRFGGRDDPVKRVF